MGEAASKIAVSAVNPLNFNVDPLKMSFAFTLSAKSPYSTSSPYKAKV
jgi:hypothetical protein